MEKDSRRHKQRVRKMAAEKGLTYTEALRLVEQQDATFAEHAKQVPNMTWSESSQSWEVRPGNNHLVRSVTEWIEAQGMPSVYVSDRGLAETILSALYAHGNIRVMTDMQETFDVMQDRMLMLEDGSESFEQRVVCVAIMNELSEQDKIRFLRIARNCRVCHVTCIAIVDNDNPTEIELPSTIKVNLLRF